VRRLQRVLKIGPGEGRTAGLGVALMLVTAAGAAIGQSGVDALFFARSGADALPVMLLFSGGLLFGVSLAVTALLGRLPRRRLFLATPIAVAVVLLAERAIVAANPSWIYPVLWLSAGAAQMLQGLFTWGLVGIVVDTRQAKRLFPLFGAGGILGAVLGGLVTRPLADALGAENLLFAWVAGLLAAFAAGRALVGATRPTAVRRRSRRSTGRVLDEMQQGFRFVRGSAVMRWMSVAAVLFSVLFFSLYLPFTRAATERFPDADALAGFFGLFSAVTTAAALASSLLLTNRLFARFGVTTMIAMLPLIYLAGFSILIVNAAFATLVAIRFVQMVWISSVAGPAWESVVNVVPPARRDQTRAFLNGAPAQFGTILAGLVLLVGDRVLSTTQLFAIGLVTAAATLGATWRVRRSYASALLEALRSGRPEVFPSREEEEPFGGQRVDGSAVAAVVAGVADPDVHVRRASAEILGDLASPGVAHALRLALVDDDATVRATALESLARIGDESASPEAVRALSDVDPDVRLAAARAVDALGDGAAESIRGALADPSAGVRSAAASALLRRGPDDDALRGVRMLLASEDPGERALGVRALAGSREPGAVALAADALDDPSPSVRAGAALALPPGDPASVPLLVRALGDEEDDARDAAADALGHVGPAALEPVLAALFDPSLAAGALAALERLPPADPDVVRGFAREEAARAVADFDVARAIDPAGDGAAALLRDALVERAHRQGRNALRAAGILGDRSSIRFAIDNLQSRDRAQVANALEALESLGEPTIVRPLLPLWEPALPRSAPRETWLPALLHDPDPWIRDCAELVGASTEGAPMTEALATLSDMERVLFLRKVPLFAELSPRDLARIAAIAEEANYADGETIAGQGEPGEELHIVVEGEVRVLREAPGGAKEDELARRTVGEVVGEMALITQDPRMASLVAAGDVRTLRVGRTAFEGVLRERPETAIAVIRVLSQRLVESAGAARAT
jgi:HEAT repeat protein